jgi:hypothetical protein
MRPMDLIHLFFEMLVVKIALLWRMSTIVRIGELRGRQVIFDGGKQLAADEFIEPLWPRGKLFEVIIVQRSDRRVVEHLTIWRIQDEIDRIRFLPVRECGTSEC